MTNNNFEEQVKEARKAIRKETAAGVTKAVLFASIEVGFNPYGAVSRVKREIDIYQFKKKLLVKLTELGEYCNEAARRNSSNNVESSEQTEK